MKYLKNYSMVLLTFSVIAMHADLASAGYNGRSGVPAAGMPNILNIHDRTGSPPLEALDAAPPITEESVQNEVAAELRAQFDKASAHSNQLLTAQGAKDAGWGFVFDHFTEMDQKPADGYLTFGEVEAFMDARSPFAKSPKTSSQKPVQIIE